jgi:hypothetical protein
MLAKVGHKGVTLLGRPVISYTNIQERTEVRNTGHVRHAVFVNTKEFNREPIGILDVKAAEFVLNGSIHGHVFYGLLFSFFHVNFLYTSYFLLLNFFVLPALAFGLGRALARDLERDLDSGSTDWFTNSANFSGERSPSYFFTILLFFIIMTDGNPLVPWAMVLPEKSLLLCMPSALTSTMFARGFARGFIASQLERIWMQCPHCG